MWSTLELFLCWKRQKSYRNTWTVAVWTHVSKHQLMAQRLCKANGSGVSWLVFQLWTHFSASEQTCLTGCSQFTDVTLHTLASWPLSSAANHFYFCSSSLKSVQILKLIKAGKIGFTCKSKIFYDEKGRHCFLHQFLISTSFFLLGYRFWNGNTCGCFFILLAHTNPFSIGFHCSLIFWFDWDARWPCWFQLLQIEVVKWHHLASGSKD